MDSCLPWCPFAELPGAAAALFVAADKELLLLLLGDEVCSCFTTSGRGSDNMLLVNDMALQPDGVLE